MDAKTSRSILGKVGTGGRGRLGNGTAAKLEGNIDVDVLHHMGASTIKKYCRFYHIKNCKRGGGRLQAERRDQEMKS